jgi:hypothetical protein
MAIVLLLVFAFVEKIFQLVARLGKHHKNRACLSEEGGIKKLLNLSFMEGI